MYKQVILKGSSNVWVCRRNHMVWPFKWRLTSSTFLCHCLLKIPVQSGFKRLWTESYGVAIYKVFFNNLIKVHQDTAGQPCKRKSLFGFFARGWWPANLLQCWTSFIINLLCKLIFGYVDLGSIFWTSECGKKKKKKKNVLPCLVVRQTAFSLWMWRCVLIGRRGQEGFCQQSIWKS